MVSGRPPWEGLSGGEEEGGQEGKGRGKEGGRKKKNCDSWPGETMNCHLTSIM